MREFYSQALTTKSSDDIERWRALVNRLPYGDIYFAPEYAMVFEATEGETRMDFGGEAGFFFYGNEQNYIIYPFFKRRISELLFYKALGSEAKSWFDIISPYGFAGPVAYLSQRKIEGKLWQGFWEEFHHYCFQTKIISEFTRLHPYFKNHLPLYRLNQIEIRKRSEVVYVNLEQDLSSMRKDFTKGNKSSISKAHRSGVKIRSSSTTDEIDAFYQLYTATMERNKAKEAYFFSREFFENTFRLLGGSVKLFSAWYQDRIIAASLFLFKGNLAHYYLSGSDANSLSLCPNNLLLYEAILWAKERGYKIFDLGGGYEPNDSLFHFKSSFSKTTADFYTYSRVHNEQRYKILCQARDKYDRLQGEEIKKTDYFPQYRR